MTRIFKITFGNQVTGEAFVKTVKATNYNEAVIKVATMLIKAIKNTYIGEDAVRENWYVVEY